MNHRMNISRNQRGFTVIEMLVVTAILVMLMTMSVIGFQSGREDDILRASLLRFADGVRKAQNNAQAGVLQGGVAYPGYGVYLDAVSGDALLYADTGTAGGGTAAVYDAGIDVLVETIRVADPGHVVVDDISLDGAGGQSSVDGTFIAPRADMLVGGAETTQNVAVRLRSLKNGHTKSVTIHRITGRVDIDY